MKAGLLPEAVGRGLQEPGLGQGEDGLEGGGQPKTVEWRQRNGGRDSSAGNMGVGWGVQRYLGSEMSCLDGLDGLRAQRGVKVCPSG